MFIPRNLNFFFFLVNQGQEAFYVKLMTSMRGPIEQSPRMKKNIGSCFVMDDQELEIDLRDARLKRL